MTDTHDPAHLAATTVSGDVQPNAAQPILRQTFADDYDKCTFAFAPAPGGRGTEIRATSDDIDKHKLKEALRRARALLEAGETPTGERR